MAKEIYDFLTEKGLKVFDSDHSLQEMGNADYTEGIDQALISSENLIVISSSIENINSNYLFLKKTYQTFQNLITIWK